MSIFQNVFNRFEEEITTPPLSHQISIPLKYKRERFCRGNPRNELSSTWRFILSNIQRMRKNPAANDEFGIRGGPLEKLWGGSVENFWAAGIFFRYQIPCMNFLGAVAWIFCRVNWRAWIFFHLILPCANIFFCASRAPPPPPPISFLMVYP